MLTEKDIAKQIATNVAQKTSLFVPVETSVTATTSGNELHIDGLNGEYTISGAQDTDDFSKACINDTHVFTDGVAKLEEYLGDEKTHQVKATKQKVLIEIDRESAYAFINSSGDNRGNVIILYKVSESSDSPDEVWGLGEDQRYNVNHTFGVIFKISMPREFMKKEGSSYGELHSILRQFVVGIQGDSVSSVVRYISTQDFGYEGDDSYFVDMLFGYSGQDTVMDTELLERMKSFTVSIEAKADYNSKKE